jgi:hypothetical protein
MYKTSIFDLIALFRPTSNYSADVDHDYEQSELSEPLWIRYWQEAVLTSQQNAEESKPKQDAIVKTFLPDLNLKNEAGCTVLTQTLRSLATLCRNIRWPLYKKRCSESIMAGEKWMFDRGANGDFVDRDGNSALHHLVGYPEQVFGLRIRECYGGLASLPVAILYELRIRLQCLRLLIRSGCDPRLCNNAGYIPSDLALWNPLMWSC